MKRLAGATLLVATMLSGVANAAKVEEVKIGFVGPMTGPQAHYGKDFQNGVTLAVEDFNATHPVIGGQPVRIILDSQNDQADPRTGTTVAQKLVDDDIRGVIGHFNSGTTIPASRIYANAGIPEVAMATAAEYTEQGFKNSFRMMTSDTQQGEVLGTFVVKKLGLKRLAVVDDRTSYGQGLAEQFEKAAKRAGAVVVDHEYTNDKAVDFKAILTKIKASRPSAIFLGGADAQAAPMVKQMRMLAMNMPLVAGEMVKSDTFLKIAGPAGEGTIASLAGLPLAEMPGGKAFADKYVKRFHEPVQTYAPYAYDGTMAMLMAMKHADSTDPARYLPFLANTNMPAVTTRALAYDEHGNLKTGGITVYQVSNGQWRVLQSVDGHQSGTEAVATAPARRQARK